MAKKIILLDSNTLVSAAAYNGFQRQILLLVLKKEVECIISKEIVAEVDKALTNKIKASPLDIKEFFEDVRKCFIFVMPSQTIDIVRDSSDNKIIEAATEGRCQYIVTGDKDLLVLKKYKNIRILSAKEFLEVI